MTAFPSLYKRKELLPKLFILLALLLLLFYWLVTLGPTLRHRDKFTCPDCNVILISADALRADHLSCYGYHRETSTNIDRLATAGLLFENVIAPSAETAPSLASMHTGLLPTEHKVRTLYQPLDAEYSTLAERLQHQGLNTAAFVSNYVLKPEFCGLEQGFELYNANFTHAELNRVHILQRNAVETNQAVIKWLDTQGSGQFFLWIHYLEPHGPYYPPEEYRNYFTHTARKMAPIRAITEYQLLPNVLIDGQLTDLNDYIDAYDEEIRYLDQQLGKLLQSLEDRGLHQNTVLIFTADHGERLAEREPYFTHYGCSENVCLKVPLIIVPPTKLAIPSARLSELLSNRDIFHFILDVLGLGNEFSQAGVLTSVLNNQSYRQGPLSSDFFKTPETWAISVQDENFKLTEWSVDSKKYRSCYELFQQYEQQEISCNSFPTKQQLTEALAEYGQASSLAERTTQVLPKPEDENTLKSLGYL